MIRYGPRLILVTGHICAGKSSLYKELLKSIPLARVDIAQVHERNENLFRPTEQFFNQEPRVYYLYTLILDLLFQKQNVFVEVLGDEPWFHSFRIALKKLWVPVIEVELQRESLECALECLKQRCFRGSASIEEQVGLYDVESNFLEDHYGYTFNPNAKKFTTSQDHCSNASDAIVQIFKEQQWKQ